MNHLSFIMYNPKNTYSTYSYSSLMCGAFFKNFFLLVRCNSSQKTLLLSLSHHFLSFHRNTSSSHHAPVLSTHLILSILSSYEWTLKNFTWLYPCCGFIPFLCILNQVFLRSFSYFQKWLFSTNLTFICAKSLWYVVFPHTLRTYLRYVTYHRLRYTLHFFLHKIIHTLLYFLYHLFAAFPSKISSVVL